MLGDIVPNSAGSNVKQGAADKTGPLPQPKTSGYGTSSFGNTAQPTTVPIAPQAPPIETAPPSVEPASSVSSPRTAIKAPLVLTVVGVIIFIGGVSGLFMYALSGS